MANEQNLIQNKGLTPEERRKNASKAGKASVASRRQKKSMKQKLQLLLSLPATGDKASQLHALGVDPDDMDNEMVLVLALYREAANGSTSAFDRIQDLLGKSVAREDLALRKQEAKRKASGGTDMEPLKKAKELLGGIDSAIDTKAD